MFFKFQVLQIPYPLKFGSYSYPTELMQFVKVKQMSREVS